VRPQTLRAALAAGAGLLLVMFFSCREIPSAAERALAAAPSCRGGAPELRVALARGRDAVKVSVTGRFKLFGSSGAEIAIQNESLSAVRVRASGGGLAVGDTRLRYGSLEFRPAAGEEVWLDGVPLPGALGVFRESDGGSVSAAGTMDVELYVCAALACTAGRARVPEAALEAYAICLRTRALYLMALARESPGSAPFDLDDPGVLSALRDGSYRSVPFARAANRTRGLVLTWDARLFPAPLTAACGGRTEDASNVLTAASITPLSGADCPHCARVKAGEPEWVVKLSTKRLTEALRPFVEGRGVYRLGAVRRVEVASTGSSGRATRLRLDTAYGPVELDAELLRSALGEATLPSTFFTVREAGPELLEFAGRGEGHGLGLCRRGAEGMALEGATSEEVLARYFPGAVLAALPYGERSARTAARNRP